MHGTPCKCCSRSQQRSSPGLRLRLTVCVLSLIHISEPTRPLYISYAVFCLKKKSIVFAQKTPEKSTKKTKNRSDTVKGSHKHNCTHLWNRGSIPHARSIKTNSAVNLRRKPGLDVCCDLLQHLQGVPRICIYTPKYFEVGGIRKQHPYVLLALQHS